MNLKTTSFDDKSKWLQEYALQYQGGGNTSHQGISGSVGSMGQMGYQGIQGVCGQSGSQGVCGQQGIQGVQGESGYMHLDSNTVFNHDIRIDDMSLRQFVHNVPVQSIEDSVVKILEKYGLMANALRFDLRFDKDATIGYPDSTLGYQGSYSPHMNEDEGIRCEELDINEFNKPKTFTLDEVIKIIESTQSTTQVVSVFNQWDNDAIVESYKHQLIETFKIL
jgi:hypothetical protein